jgi:iron complex outermembrane recepter protein
MSVTRTIAPRAFAMASTSAIALTLFAAAPAFAQTTPATAETAPQSRLETVIVTARKREESSQDVPVSLSTVRGDAITTLTSGGADMNAFSGRVPSLVVESSFGRTFPRFYLRGLGNSDFDLNASQPVSLIYDEVVFENPVLKGFPVFDVERIEVLRGPQGTLFGRNTPAGIVKFDSVKPTEKFGGYVRGGARSFGGRDIEGAIGGAIGDGVSFRVSALYTAQDDWITNTGPLADKKLGAFDDTAIRAQLRFQPNDQLDALINVHARELTGTSQIFRANVITRGVRGLNSNFKADRVNYDQGEGNNQELTSQGVTARVSYDFGDVTLTSISGYEELEFRGRGDIDGGSMGTGPGFIPFPSDTADGIDDHSQFSQELRLSSNGNGNFGWQLGAYYFQEDLSIFSLGFFSPTGIFTDARQVQDTESWAVFGSVNFKPMDKLAITAGLRYTDDDKKLTARGGIANIPPVSRQVSDSAVSWDISATYDATETANLYARAARGYRAPSIQGRILFGTAVTVAQSEFVTSFEAGVKLFTADRRLRADFSVFDMRIEDQQFTAIGGAGNFNQLLNAKEGLASGFEAEGQWLPTDNLSFAASLSYNKTRINDANLRVGACGAPCTVLNPIIGGNAAINGNPFPNAPQWIGNVSAKYSVPFGNGNEFFALTDWAYKGETYFTLYKSIEFSEGGYWEGGLRTGVTLNDGRYEIAAYGRNIMDEQRLVGGIDFNNLTGFVNAPRIIGVEGKAKF